MTLQEKIASVNKLERIDSSIDSCIKILEQELEKRKVEVPGLGEHHASQLLNALSDFRIDFNIMRGKK